MTSESVDTSENVDKPENASQEEGAVDPKADQDLPVARQALSDEHIQQIIEAALLAAEGPGAPGDPSSQFVSPGAVSSTPVVQPPCPFSKLSSKIGTGGASNSSITK